MSKAFKPVAVPKKTDIVQDTPAEILFPSNQDRDPKYQTEPSIEDKLNRIIEEEQTKTRYDTAMEDLNSVIKQLDLSRDVLLSSCRTFDDIRPTFLYFIDKATAAIDELQKFKDYFENIESLTFNAKLDQSSVDILLKYNEFVANSEKERLSKYLEEVDSTLDEHYDKFKQKIRDSEGVWLPRKVFWWAVVIIYGLLVITFLLGCFWCMRRFG